MWKPIYQPEPWPQYLKRKENVGVPIMEVRKKYLEEQLLFENYVSSLQTLNVSSPSVGGGGPLPSSTSTGPGPGPAPGPGGEYQFVEDGAKVYYWQQFRSTTDRLGDPLLTGLRTGVLNETTTLFTTPSYPGYTPQSGFPVYSDDTNGTTVFKIGYRESNGDWDVEPFVWTLPTDLNYKDWDYEDFEPFTTTGYYLPYSWQLQTTTQPIALVALDNPSGINTFDSPRIAILTKNMSPTSEFLTVDWTKILREDIDLSGLEMVLAPGSGIDPSFASATWTGTDDILVEGDGLDDLLAYLGISSTNINGNVFYDTSTSSWLFVTLDTFTFYQGPAGFDNLWEGTDPGTGEWSPGHITSIGKLIP